jgi:glycosyltransferase involved in cell wall biosynthesis
VTDTFTQVSSFMHMKNSKKALVILSPGFPTNEKDSTCLPAQQAFIQSLNTLFPHTKIIILAFQYPFTGSQYTWHGNTVIPLDGRNRNKPYRWLVWFKARRQLEKIYKNEEVIGVLSFWLDECAMAGHRFSNRKKLPHFIWILGQDAKPGNPFVNKISPKSDSLIAMSDFLARIFYDNYGIRPGHVITNGIDPSRYQPNQKTRDIDIIGVGSLIPLKRYDLFIEIIKSLQLSLPGIKVLICGKGDEQENLEKLIQENRLDYMIQLTGEKTHDEILELMQRSKLMLHTSSYEGFSGACLEALYAGTHVISFFSPQDGWIRHWHIVNHSQAMTDTALALLHSDTLDHSPVLPYDMKDTATAVMKLFTR